MSLPADLRDDLAALAATPHLLVVSDFDGTLAPLVNVPADARGLPAAASALHILADLPDTTVALVSGRARDVLRELARLSDIPATVHLVGSHGAESDAGFGETVDTDKLARVVAGLTAIAGGRPGITVETKPASAALHVRTANDEDAQAALAQARHAAQDWDVHTTAGKAVLEFAVVQTDKGQALDTMRASSGATAAIFLGDDVTDENAFRRMRDGDVGVKVGPGDTAARHRVDAPSDVAEVLETLATARRTPGRR